MSPQTLFSIWSESATWNHVIGYGFALVAPMWPLAGISKLWWMAIAAERGVPVSVTEPRHRSDIPMLIGVLERALYVAFILAGEASFVFVWLALKVGGNWKEWSDGMTLEWQANGAPGSVRIEGRHLFNTHLIGSGLSLLNALVGASIIAWLADGLWPRVIWVSLLTVVGTATPCVYAWQRVRKFSKAAA